MLVQITIEEKFVPEYVMTALDLMATLFVFAIGLAVLFGGDFCARQDANV